MGWDMIPFLKGCNRTPQKDGLHIGMDSFGASGSGELRIDGGG